MNIFRNLFSRYHKGNAKVKQAIAEWMAYVMSMGTQADLRTEIVQTFENTPRQVSLKNHSEEFWTAGEDDENWVFLLPRFLNALVDANSFLMITDWPAYVAKMIDSDLQTLNKMIGKSVICPSKEYVSNIYTLEQRFISFVEGLTLRHDTKHMRQLMYPNEGKKINYLCYSYLYTHICSYL